MVQENKVYLIEIRGVVQKYMFNYQEAYFGLMKYAKGRVLFRMQGEIYEY